MSQLEIFAQHRDAILLAEAVGWLCEQARQVAEQLHGGGRG